jgi:hypothetical protein
MRKTYAFREAWPYHFDPLFDWISTLPICSSAKLLLARLHNSNRTLERVKRGEAGPFTFPWELQEIAGTFRRANSAVTKWRAELESCGAASYGSGSWTLPVPELFCETRFTHFTKVKSDFTLVKCPSLLEQGEESSRKVSLRDRADMINRSAKSSSTLPTTRRRKPSDRSTPADSCIKHPNQPRRDEHRALAAFQRRAQASHYRNLAKAFGQILFDCETSRDRSPACVLDVEGATRCADRRGHQPGSSPSFNNEKGHAKVQREIPSQRFDLLRLGHSSRHIQPPRSRRNLQSSATTSSSIKSVAVRGTHL